MDLASTLHVGLPGTVFTAAPAAQNRQFDWAGMHARFAAAHAVRRELAPCESASARRTGAFAGWAYPALGTGERFSLVNRTDSADGKSPMANEADTAGSTSVGGRG